MKVSPHRQAILIFGIVVPLFLIGALSIATFVGHSKLNWKFEEKVAALERYTTSESQVKELEAFLTTDNRREKIAYWNSKLETDFVESLSKNLDKLLAKYDSEVLRQTEMGQASGLGSLGPKTKHPHARMQLSFEGGYKPMQMLLAELETEMPHLVLESLMIQPKAAISEGEKSTLKFSITYLCWEKPKASPAQP